MADRLVYCRNCHAMMASDLAFEARFVVATCKECGSMRNLPRYRWWGYG